jgi:hypothetical protein
MRPSEAGVEMTIAISPKSVEETNLLLRAIWAELRSEFGECLWQFLPRRDGENQTIWFGWAQLNIGDTVGFGVAYERKGIATHLLVRRCPDGQLPRIEACVRRAESRLPAPGEYDTPFLIRLHPDLWVTEHKAKSFDISPRSGGLFSLTLKGTPGFDELDADVEAVRRLRVFLDALSFLTNCPFDVLSRHEFEMAVATARRPAPDPAARGTQTLQRDWIDDFPLVGGEMTLLPEEWEYLERIASDNLTEADDHLADAAHHFHAGRRAELDLGSGVEYNESTATESSLVSYISSLEVVSLIEAEGPGNCSTCGQPRYKISDRVTQYVHQRLGPVCSDLMKQAYRIRSSYLHAGRRISGRAFFGRRIPQLDPCARNGVVATVSSFPLRNLREFTSFCLRRCLG